MSESEKSHVGRVYSRWIDIKSHLEHLIPTHSSIQPLLAIFESRLHTQIMPIHLVAYYLDPSNALHRHYTHEEFDSIIKFISHYGGEEAKSQFALFLVKEGHFRRHHEAWSLSDRPLLFWALLYPFAPELSRLALRVFKTPANSVPSERAFSTHNLIHDKRRNRLQVEKVDKLVFIHRNTRVLEKCAGGWDSVSEVDLLEMEDDFVASLAFASSLTDSDKVGQ
jgi:hypothetical protein